MNSSYPERIVCLTEETTETLYLLGRGIPVVAFNQRSVAEILQMIRMLGGLIGCQPPKSPAAFRSFRNWPRPASRAIGLSIRQRLPGAIPKLSSRPGPASLTEGVRQLHEILAQAQEG